MELTEHGAGLGVERGEQVGDAVTQVIMAAALGLAGTHRRLTAIERLNLRFLVDPQHQRFVRR